MKLRVKEISKNKKLSISDLAAKLEVTRETLSRQIAENGNPTIETLEKIARALEVPITELFPASNRITGAVRVGDNVHLIDSLQDLENIIEDLRKNPSI